MVKQKALNFIAKNRKVKSTIRMMYFHIYIAFFVHKQCPNGEDHRAKNNTWLLMSVQKT